MPSTFRRIYGYIAPAIGHAQQTFAGIIYSHVGMLNERRISMDKATRVEAAYMREHRRSLLTPERRA